MRRLLSLVTLSCAMAIGAGVSVSSAHAATLTNAVHSLKREPTSVVEKAYYRRYYNGGYYRHYYHHPYYYGPHYYRLYYYPPSSFPDYYRPYYRCSARQYSMCGVHDFF
jgi:hypothetical protein